MRHAAKIDSNHVAIVKALRAVGCSVQSLAAVGTGVPDLLCGRDGLTQLIEVKDGTKVPSKRRLTPDQEVWCREWKGSPVRVVTSVAEALAVCFGHLKNDRLGLEETFLDGLDSMIHDAPEKITGTK